MVPFKLRMATLDDLVSQIAHECGDDYTKLEEDLVNRVWRITLFNEDDTRCASITLREGPVVTKDNGEDTQLAYVVADDAPDALLLMPLAPRAILGILWF